MSGTFEKSSRRTLRDSRNATSSLESEFGVMPFAEPDGQTVIPFGQGAAHANLSVRAGKVEASPIRVICGPHGSGSSASVALALSLGSRLHQKMAWRGSTLFHLTLKMEATPLGRRYWALRGSARRTSATGCGSWPTPNRPTGGPNSESTETHTGGRDLDGAMRLASWATPQVHDDKLRGNTMADHHDSPHDLSNQALLASWNTPTSEDTKTDGPKAMRKWEDHRQTGAGLPTSVQRLRNQAQALAAWPSPMAGSPATENY